MQVKTNAIFCSTCVALIHLTHSFFRQVQLRKTFLILQKNSNLKFEFLYIFVGHLDTFKEKKGNCKFSITLFTVK